MEDVLKYVYGKKADFEVGETYGYCNTNYLLLSMILESASGMSFQSVYEQEVFIPAGLNSAYYSESQPIPDDCVKGYADIYGTGQYAESTFLYQDEIGIGGDGGVAINVYDLSVFLEKLMKGELISESSLNEMTNWFDMPEFWHWFPYGQTENGYGFEKFNTAYGYAVGHTGGMDGFSTYGFYFPEEDMTYVLFINSVGDNEAETDIFEETMEVMFEG
jgi:D-alanyl-D-alanine carboxypeptidase